MCPDTLELWAFLQMEQICRSHPGIHGQNWCFSTQNFYLQEFLQEKNCQDTQVWQDLASGGHLYSTPE